MNGKQMNGGQVESVVTLCDMSIDALTRSSEFIFGVSLVLKTAINLR